MTAEIYPDTSSFGDERQLPCVLEADRLRMSLATSGSEAGVVHSMPVDLPDCREQGCSGPTTVDYTGRLVQIGRFSLGPEVCRQQRICGRTGELENTPVFTGWVRSLLRGPDDSVINLT